jgi:hypothetical protein
MTEAALRHIRPIRDRAWLFQRQDELTAEMEAVDAEQRQLGQKFFELRRELKAVHELLWPPTPGYDHRKTARPELPGPAPIPPPPPDATLLRGRALRRAALAALGRAGVPQALPDIHRALHLAGQRLTSDQPVKQLADALRYEEQKGRVRRVARGTYERS